MSGVLGVTDEFPSYASELGVELEAGTSTFELAANEVLLSARAKSLFEKETGRDLIGGDELTLDGVVPSTGQLCECNLTYGGTFRINVEKLTKEPSARRRRSKRRTGSCANASRGLQS